METLLGCALQGVKSHHSWSLDFTQPSHVRKELGCCYPYYPEANVAL